MLPWRERQLKNFSLFLKAWLKRWKKSGWQPLSQLLRMHWGNAERYVEILWRNTLGSLYLIVTLTRFVSCLLDNCVLMQNFISRSTWLWVTTSRLINHYSDTPTRHPNLSHGCGAKLWFLGSSPKIRRKLGPPHWRYYVQSWHVGPHTCALMSAYSPCGQTWSQLYIKMKHGRKKTSS